MKEQLTSRWQSVVAFALLALLLPHTAWAACGDHIRLRKDQHANQAPSAEFRVDSRPSPSHPKLPCTGPMCTQGRAPLPMPFTGLIQLEEWACPPILAVPLEAPAYVWIHHFLSIAPINRAASIYHPPR